MFMLRLLLLGLVVGTAVDCGYAMEQAPVAADSDAKKRVRDEASVKPLTIKQAKEEYAAALNAGVSEADAVREFQDAKNAIKTHYTKEVADGVTAFAVELLPICVDIKKSIEALPTLENNQKYTIVWDIDETLLSNAELAFEENFETKRGTDSNYTFRVNMRCKAIHPMVQVLNDLDGSCNHVFVTSRRGWMPGLADATLANLCRDVRADISKNNLYLLEKKYTEGDSKISLAAWKRLVRDELRAKGHVIIACIGDGEDDMAMSDEKDVVNFKLPNYLY